ncbi:chloride transport protein 6-like [Gigantopelta aegis]|uniref:chloride transport protein 6-like n=1 Tax=Gigantopelta aegis TaxID=1735272 RepID=UPI001B88DF96|nr:chloride transport protein 6-like [Gigantopelta aegis]
MESVFFELVLRCCPGGRHTHSVEDGTASDEEQRPLLERPQTSVPRKDYESLDYDRFFNKPYEDLLERQRKEHSEAKLGIIKWIVTFIVGFLTGMVALYIDVLVKLLTAFKFSTVDKSIQTCSKDGCLVISLLWLLLFNVGFVVIASCLTVYEPVAGGSGIPEIKCYLNGVKVPNMVRLHTLVAKSVGVLFSVAGGLFVGKEGPMIHSGAIIGAGVPQFQSLAFKKINFNYSVFRTDRDKRDFVSGGAAAGVAAAFGAPIGGVLFSLEEGSSFWNQKLTWRTFFCSMAATFSLNFFLSGIDKHSWGFFYLPGLIDFGEFKCHGKETDCRLWNAIDLFIFVLIGLIGGLLGAIFNTLNSALTVYRMKHVHKKHKIYRILEAMLVAMLTTTIAFVAAMTLGECRKMPTQVNGTETIEGSVRTYFCKDGYYNDMATLFFNSQEVGIKQLFHQSGTFSMPTLGIFFIVFFFLACWTYGVAVPSGLFVPSLFCGAAYGRFIANLLENYIGYDTVYSGTFALIGAAAFLGGVVRMTISLTVILIESTNEISYGLPLMLTLMVAKWAGDVFNEGLYDIHITLKGVPLLEWDVSSEASRLKARDIMDRKLVVVFPKTRVSSLVRILKTTVHNAFPVVTMSDRNECDLMNNLQNDVSFYFKIVFS